MKISTYITVVLVFFFFTASKCKKDTGGKPIDQLPPETQTGANTFGCLVNGQAFLPYESIFSSSSATQCNYQFFNHKYYVVISGTNNGTNSVQSVGVYTDSLKISEGQKYVLMNRINGNASADYFWGASGGNNSLYRTNNYGKSGELFISKLDTNNQIMSGTFWFNAVDKNGDSVKVTGGRFDLRYTR